MRWEVIGADARTGKERRVEFDAADEAAARAMAQYNELMVSEVRQLAETPIFPPPAPLPVMDYARPSESADNSMRELAAAAHAAKQAAAHVIRAGPGAGAEVTVRFLKSRTGRLLQGVCAIFGLSIGLWLLSYAWWRPGVATAVLTGSPPPASASPANPITYDQIAGPLGDRFVLEREPMMNGTTKYIGTDVSMRAVIVIQGSKEDVRYSHLAVVASVPFWEAIEQNRETMNGDPSEVQIGKAQILLMHDYLACVLPDWKDGTRWTIDEIRSLLISGEPRGTVRRGGRAITVTIDSARMIKIAVEPL